MSSPATDNAFQWLYNIIFRFLQRMLLAVLASGPIPNHVAFVMDGNRRYAGRQGKPVYEGHYAGFSALRRVSYPPYSNIE
jgi:ditrans,polycis-polyprenyl diphosphate synthase